MNPGPEPSQPSREKMIFRILLLLSLLSCVSGAFVVNVAQTSYQAEENHSVTLEWTFTTRPDTSSESIFIHCAQITDQKTLFHLHRGAEVSEFQDERFSGRVQFDRDVLREGRVRLQLSRLRTDDSGAYLCEVRTGEGRSSGRCRLNVTAVGDSPATERETEGHTEHPGRIDIYWGLTAAVLVVCCFLFIYCFKNINNNRAY